MPESLSEQLPSPLQLRAQLESMIHRNLFSPTSGPEEEANEVNVRGNRDREGIQVAGP